MTWLSFSESNCILRITVSSPLLWFFILIFSPSISYSQADLRIPERPDDPYVAPTTIARETSPAFSSSSRGFFFTQVNVDSNGQNIVGDAANEPSIAVDPTNPLKIIIGWRQFDTISSNFRQAGNGYTTDGGLTWQYHDVIQRGLFRSDPVLASDSYGVTYYNSLTSSGGNFSCQVFKSYNGGMTWDGGVNAQGGDKQWMVIDKTGGLSDGHSYAFWTSFYTACPPGFFTRSTNYGASFESCGTIPGDPYWGTLAVGPEGDLYVGGASDFGFQVVRSTNAQDSAQTVSWNSSVPVNLDGYISTGGPNSGGLLGQTWVAVDRISTSDPLDVMFARSTDEGATWSSPIRVNDDPGTSAYQWFGTMSVAPDGRIDVIWLDTRDNPGTNLSSLYYSSSTDAGVTWATNQRLSSEFNPQLGYPQQDKMGDYYHMESDLEGAHLAWAGTFNGEQDVYYGRILAEGFIPAAPVLASPPDGALSEPLSVSLLWNPAVGASSYHVQVDTTGDFTNSIVDDSTITTIFRNVDGLTTSTTYYWRVSAKGSGGAGDWSGTWNFTTSLNPPAPPALVSPVDGATINPPTVMCVWSDTAMNATYRLQVAGDADFLEPVLDVTGITTTSWEVSGLDPQTTYYWRVHTLNAGGTSIWSDVWDFTTTVFSPAAPDLFSPLDGAVLSTTSILFRWYAVPGAAMYRFQLATDDSFVGIVDDDSTLTGILKLETNLTPGVYYWRVNASNEGGTSPWSDIWSVTLTTTDVAGQPELPTEYALSQNHPNPFNPSTTIEYALPRNSFVRLDLFDLLGQHIQVLTNDSKQAGYHTVRFNAAGLPSGMYFYRIEARPTDGTQDVFVEAKKLLLVK